MSVIEDRQADGALRHRLHDMTGRNDHIDDLTVELARLEALLAGDEAFAALRQLDERATRGEPLSAIDERALRRDLEANLAGNPYFVARRHVLDEISRLRSRASQEKGPSPAPERMAAMPPARSSRLKLSERIALIEPMPRGDVFRTRLHVKPVDPLAAAMEHKPQDATGNEDAAGPLPGTIHDVARQTGSAVPEDLTRIRGIDADMSAALDAIGIRLFADIARWTAADVRHVKTALGLGRRIATQGWIEQAAMLADGRATWYSTTGTGYEVASSGIDSGVPRDLAEATFSTVCSAIVVPTMAAAEFPEPARLTGNPTSVDDADKSPSATAAPTVAAIAAAAVAETGSVNPPPMPLPVPAVEGAARVASPPPEINPRTLALFERARWQDDIRSLQATVLAAEAAARQRLHQPAREEPQRPAPVAPGMPSVAIQAPETAAGVQPGQQAEGHALPAVPPPPPVPYRAPVTHFGQAPQTEVDLSEIVRGLRHVSPGLDGQNVEYDIGDDEAFSLDAGGEEAVVEIVARSTAGNRAPPPVGKPSNQEQAPEAGVLRPLPVKARPPAGTAPQVRVLESEGHEAYRGILMEASVEIIQYDEEGRRIPKATPKST